MYTGETWACVSMMFFFFNDTATTEIYTLSLHDALPISGAPAALSPEEKRELDRLLSGFGRSEEHTSELQSRQYLVCRLLLEKKKQQSPKRPLPIPKNNCQC